MFLEISENSQENTCARVFFLTTLLKKGLWPRYTEHLWTTDFKRQPMTSACAGKRKHICGEGKVFYSFTVSHYDNKFQVVLKQPSSTEVVKFSLNFAVLCRAVAT